MGAFVPSRRGNLGAWSKHRPGTGNREPREGGLKVSQGNGAVAVGRPRFAHPGLSLIWLFCPPHAVGAAWPHDETLGAPEIPRCPVFPFGELRVVGRMQHDPDTDRQEVTSRRVTSNCLGLTAWGHLSGAKPQSHKWHVPLSWRSYERGPFSCRAAISPNLTSP